jgi:outer membrane protein assembly factor BamB
MSFNSTGVAKVGLPGSRVFAILSPPFMHHTLSISLSPLAIAFAAISSLSAADWPQFQGPQRDGTSIETGLNLTGWGNDGPPLLWDKSLNEGWGGAAIVGDEVFLVDRDLGERDRLLCLSLTDGSEKWQVTYDYPGSLPHPGSRGVPLVENEAVYFIGGFGQVFRVDRNAHKIDWMVSLQEQYSAEPPKWGWAQSPVVVGDILIVPAMSTTVGLIGLDKKTGKERWRTEGIGNSHSTPTVLTLQGVEQVVFVSTGGGEGEIGTTISVRPDSGEVLWKTNLYFNKIPIPFPTKVSEELVFLTGGYGNGSHMIRVKAAQPQWTVESVFPMTQGTQIHPPFLIDDHLYFLANENDNHKGEARLTGGLTCMKLDGTILWNTGDKPFMGRGNMIQVDGHLLIQDGEVGYLRVIEPSPEAYREVAFADAFGKKPEVDAQIAKQEGRENLKIPDFKYWSPMALGNGHLIVRGQGTMRCFDLRN